MMPEWESDGPDEDDYEAMLDEGGSLENFDEDDWYDDEGE